MAILAGGLGTRLGALARHSPKALTMVAGRPFVDHQLQLVGSQGITDVTLCVGHHGSMIRDHVGDGEKYGLRVKYSFDGPARLGTGGALREAIKLLPGVFFVEYGDTYLQAPLAQISDAFMQSNKAALMTVYRNNNELEPSNVAYEDGRIMTYNKESPNSAMSYVDFGLLAFRREVLQLIPEGKYQDLAPVLQSLVADGDVLGYEVLDRFYEIGTASSLAETAHVLAASALQYRKLGSQ